MSSLAVRCLFVVLLSGLLTMRLAVPASAVTTGERAVARSVNRSRALHGPRALRLSDAISRFARRHSAAMARRGALFHHSCLGCIMRRHGWWTIGENVGYASTIRGMDRAFMQS